MTPETIKSGLVIKNYKTLAPHNVFEEALSLTVDILHKLGINKEISCKAVRSGQDHVFLVCLKDSEDKEINNKKLDIDSKV